VLNHLSRILFRSARLSRDVNAVARGPKAMAKRVGRKAMGRTYGRLARRVLP
jgi:hypothetical protein